MEILVVPQGEFQLSRYPEVKNNYLRAWDAADEYLLNYLYESSISNHNLNILIVNDSFGALTTALASHVVTVWTDSYLSQEGINSNLLYNKQSTENITIKHSTEIPEDHFNLVLIKIPKSLAMLEDQLIRLKPLITSETQIIAGAMVKVIHTSTLKLFEKYIGTTHTSLAKKKARLIYCQDDEKLAPKRSLYPSSYILEGTPYTIINHANLFSRENLDIGTRLFLQYIPRSEKYRTIVDLACGNGVLGLIAAEYNPEAKLIFLDESYMAVASARETFEAAFGQTRTATFKVTDTLQGIAEDSVDLILNNPPFHQQHAVGDEVALKMFKESKNVLKQKGELWVIGNRHLGYHVKLKNFFGNCKIVASNKKFVILKAIKETG